MMPDKNYKRVKEMLLPQVRPKFPVLTNHIESQFKAS